MSQSEPELPPAIQALNNSLAARGVRSAFSRCSQGDDPSSCSQDDHYGSTWASQGGEMRRYCAVPLASSSTQQPNGIHSTEAAPSTEASDVETPTSSPGTAPPSAQNNASVANLSIRTAQRSKDSQNHGA